MHNEGNYVISLGAVTKWLGAQAEALGVEIFPGFTAAEVLYDDKGAVRGVATGNLGIGKDGEPMDSFQLGMELLGKYTLFAEGARGHLGKQLIAQVQARCRARPAELCHRRQGAVGESTAAQAKPGLVVHTAGWPMDDHTYGGGFLYHQEGNKVTLGFVVGLDYKNPWLSPFEEMQRWKTHPSIRAHIEGGKRIGYGARAITAGGILSLPKLVFPGGALIGCDAGFLNASRIKGSHAAMKTGMLCAEAAFAALQAGRAHDELSAFPDSLQGQLAARGTGPIAQLQAVVQEGPPGRHADDRHRTMAAAQAGLQEPAVDDPPHAGRSPVSEAGSRVHADLLSQARRQAHLRPAEQRVHQQHQPRGTAARAPDAEGRQRAGVHQPGALCGAGVTLLPGRRLRVREERRQLGPTGQINAQNCVHCKTCDIKDPTQNIVWVTPEGGGGPNYAGM